jgi:hypothetical protein
MTRVRFQPVGRAPTEGVPYYDIASHALDFRAEESAPQIGTHSSVALGTVQLEVAVKDGRCLWLWGYCPTTSWHYRAVAIPTLDERGLEAVADVDMVPAVSIAMGPKVWPTTFDLDTGWLRLERTGERAAEACAVEFATDSAAVLSDAGELLAVLVRPQNWELLAAQRSAGRLHRGG